MTARALRPFEAAGGSAGSLLKREGWSSTAYNTIVTVGGTRLRLNVEAPKAILRYLTDGYQIAVASTSALATEIAHDLCVGGGYASTQTWAGCHGE